MRRRGAFLLAFGLTMTATCLSAQEPEAKPEPKMTSVPWYRYVFLGERPKPIPAAKPVAAKESASSPKTMSREDVARALKEEQRVFLQRLEAISRIRQIAEDTGNKEMLQRATELERQAEEIYQQRTAQLPGIGPLDNRSILEGTQEDKGATAERTVPRRRPMPGDKR